MPDVSQQLQANLDPPLLTRGPLLGKARRLPHRGREALVPMPPTPPMRHASPLPRPNKVHPSPLPGLNPSPPQHRNLQVLPPPPMPIRPLAMLSPTSAKVLATTQRTKVTTRRIADEHDIPAMPPVSTVRATSRNVRLSTKAHASVPSSSSLNPDFRSVVHQLRGA